MARQQDTRQAASICGRRFDPALCCEHLWHAEPSRRYFCNCGAECVRDERGKIIDFSAGAVLP